MNWEMDLAFSLAAAKQMRVAWLTRGEVEEHLESKDSVP
jgi:hypothetical protein